MADAGAEDLEQLTVEVLKQRCREQGLKVGGRKADLIQRLQGAPSMHEEGKKEPGAGRKEDDLTVTPRPPPHDELRLEIVACKS
ncbi:hypothetical protein GUITHDRAFT_156686 [Guillardia theta CCMP2712]|uniref:SAP domain-containing protein n=1 Tax=Guillardia theta (strain CCMP2712) TaxID=905079 RepID=L1I470_GUITC|nr:hypothetical protein GUITHDRAFT_156686 [Guillardia theta CCMP2712]EKX31063.1 hypothetical protein GUITHDRAFT_156686 [Guillardia theta CCMP2712]|eukprot:XP_005818043.1 hypothetical protein GUITHDRAFT_156686 [Guillardia theta CCMP2712]